MTKIVLILMAFPWGCIEPFEPEFSGDISRVLVVDGEITTGTGPYEIRLSWIRPYESGISYEREAVAVEGAVVRVLDSEGNTYLFNENLPGEYGSDSSAFRAEPGLTYQLLVDTQYGRRFESVPEEMPRVVPISVLYASYEEVTLTGVDGIQRTSDGMQVYADVNSQEGPLYLRYEYKETYEITNWGSFFYRLYLEGYAIYVSRQPHDSTFGGARWPYATDIPDFCWKTFSPPRYLNYQAVAPRSDGRTITIPVHFIPVQNDPRLTRKYAILVRQYAISRQTYEFWRRVELQGDYTGSFYDPVPSRIYSNVYEVDREEPMAAGYFFLSSVSTERLIINREDVPDIPFYYHPQCQFYDVYADVPGDWLKLYSMNTECCFDCRVCADQTAEKPDYW